MPPREIFESFPFPSVFLCAHPLETPTMNVFTVICLYPKYATEDYGTDTVIRTVEATNAFEASRQVQRIATREAYVAIKQPTDFQVIAVFPGHVRPALEARNFRQPA